MKKIYYEKSHGLKKDSKFAVIPLFFLVFVLIIISVTFLSVHDAAKESVNASEITAPTATIFPTIHDDRLKQTVENALRGTTGSYGVVVKNLDSGEHYEFNEHVSYNSASLYKLWVMAVAYQQIEEGKLSESTVLSEDLQILNKQFGIPTDDSAPSIGNVAFTVGDALYKMITVSDNNAALLLTEKIRLSSITSFLADNKFEETVINRNTILPTTTPHDVALFFEKIYRGEMGNKESTEKMLSLLKAQQLNSKIPRLLPADIIIAHKTGELDDYTHDAGLILDKRGDFLVVVMSKSGKPDQAATRIANISNAIYTHYILGK